MRKRLARLFASAQERRLDIPFQLPADSLEIVLDLPFPPSTNHIWRRTSRKVYRSAKYLKWLDRADMQVIASRQFPRRKILGKFEAEILLNESSGTGDADNRIKAILDWAQSRDVIYDDKNCRRLVVAWVEHDRAPEGCRLTLRSLHG